MMKFKTNHSPGPFSIQEEDEFANCMILDSDGNRIAEQWSTSSDVVDAANVHLFKASPATLEYMMERAKKLSEEISYGDSVADHFELIGYMEPEKREELKTILSILKDAGVEVVE